MPETGHLLAIALAWGLYGGLHSWLAGNAPKARVDRRWPALTPAYRLVFNGLALVLLLPPLWLTWTWPGPVLWHWPAWLAWPAALAAVAGYVWSLRWYDGLDFLGLRQWRSRAAAEVRNEAFVLSPLHRCVRHPWYSLGLLLLWTRDLNAGWLVAALAVTVYVVIGSRLEDEKLAALYGDAYRRYRARVPGLLPRPWRCLGRAEAEAIQAGAKSST